MPASRASASSATHAALSLAGALVWRRGARELELALALGLILMVKALVINALGLRIKITALDKAYA